jgi:hypothetical protein
MPFWSLYLCARGKEAVIGIYERIEPFIYFKAFKMAAKRVKMAAKRAVKVKVLSFVAQMILVPITRFMVL